MADHRDSPYLPPLDFGPADVAANRRGELSIDQQIRLSEIAEVRDRWTRRTVPWMALGIGVLLVVGLVIEWGRDDQPGARGAMFTFVGLCLFLAGAVYASYRMGLARPHGVTSVRTAEGDAEPKVVRRRTRTGWYESHELHLHDGTGRRRFTLADQATLDRFRAGERYRVYWVPERPWPIVLSVETVAERGDVPWGGSGGGR